MDQPEHDRRSGEGERRIVDKTILIVGFGTAAQYLLDMLARTPGIEADHLAIATRGIDDARARINTTLVAAGLVECFPRISLYQLDLNDLDRTAALLEELRPDVVIYTARFMKGLKYGSLSYPNGIGYGAWTPLAIPLVYKLMLAVRQARVATRVVNSSYPDAVCPALAGIGLAPFTGAGNLNHLIPRIRMAVALTKGVSVNDVRVTMLGSHFLNTYVSREGTSKGSPYYLSCTVRGQPVEGLSNDDMLAAAQIPMSSGPVRNLMIASDLTRIVDSILNDKGLFMHLPGPNGLIGGYPARIYRDWIDVVVPPELTIAQAVELNGRSLAYDGVERIEGGTIHFTKELVDTMQRAFGVAYPRSLAVEECETFARRLQSAVGAAA
jgi:hypothetical protein